MYNLRPIGKTRWPSWSLIGWDIFDLFSETAKRNLSKLDWKQDPNVLYICTKFVGGFFLPIGKTRWPSLLLIGWDVFNSPLKPLNGIQRNLTWLEARSQRPLSSLCFSGRSEKQDGRPAFDWLKHFRLLIWTEFNETWQDAISQRRLRNLCFSGRSEKQHDRSGLWLTETFLTFPLKPLKEIPQHLTGSKISTFSTKFVFLCRSEKYDGHPDIWIVETVSTSPLKLLNGIQHYLIGIKISTSSTKFVIFGPIGKTRWPPGVWLADTFSTSPLITMNGIQRNVTKSKISTSSTQSGFFCRSVNKNDRHGWSVKKVAHCTQVHDMWPVGFLVSSFRPKYNVMKRRSLSLFRTKQFTQEYLFSSY